MWPVQNLPLDILNHWAQQRETMFRGYQCQNLKCWWRLSLLVQIFGGLILEKKYFLLCCKVISILHCIKGSWLYAVEILFRYSGVNYHGRSSGASNCKTMVQQKYLLGVLVWRHGRRSGVALQGLGAAEMHSGSPSGLCQISPLVASPIHFTFPPGLCRHFHLFPPGLCLRFHFFPPGFSLRFHFFPQGYAFVFTFFLPRVMRSSSSQVPLTLALPVWVKMLNPFVVRPSM